MARLPLPPSSGSPSAAAAGAEGGCGKFQIYEYRRKKTRAVS